MQCPHVRCVVLADTVIGAPIILWVGPEQAPDLGCMCQAVSLLEFSVCTMPWLEQGMMHSRCSVSISLGARLAGLISRLSLFLPV